GAGGRVGGLSRRVPRGGCLAGAPGGARADRRAARAHRHGRGVTGGPERARGIAGVGRSERRGATVRRLGTCLVLAARRAAAGPTGAAQRGAPSSARGGAAADLGVVPGIEGLPATAAGVPEGTSAGAFRGVVRPADGLSVGGRGAEGDGGAPSRLIAGPGASRGAVAQQR